MHRLAAGALALAAAQCAIHPPGPETFAFGVMGDTPYNAFEEKHFVRMLERIDREHLEFVVHVGDIKGSGPCTDAFFESRKALFDRSAHPFAYTPGDNEWVDCRTPRMGSMDPLDRLAALRRIFFADEWTLGKRRMATEAQRECVDGPPAACKCPIYVENRRWTIRRVAFVTLNYAGQDNNVGHDRANDEEARCRSEANRRWLDRAFRDAAGADVAALVVITQANPWFTPNNAFDAFLAQFAGGAAALRKPLLFIHGDTHFYRVDQPFRDATGQPLVHVTRLETFGSPMVAWVKVDVDTSRPDPFAFDSRLVAVDFESPTLPRSGGGRVP